MTSRKMPNIEPFFFQSVLLFMFFIVEILNTKMAMTSKLDQHEYARGKQLASA